MATSLHNWSCRLSLFSSKAHLLHHSSSSSSNWNHTLKNSRKQPPLARLTALVPSLSNMDKHKGQSDGGACSHHLIWMFIGAELIWKLWQNGPSWQHLECFSDKKLPQHGSCEQQNTTRWTLWQPYRMSHQTDRWLPNSLFISTTESIGLLAFASSLPNSKPRSQAFIVNSPKNWVYLYSIVYHTV